MSPTCVLAKQLGPPWNDLVVPTVMKFPQHPDTQQPMIGAASVFRGGKVGKRGFYDAVPEQVSAAAFFDALIGQQDRNKGNVLWYEERQVIYLIDHAFSFARAGANHGASDLVQWRWGHGSRRLDAAELDALQKLLDSPALLTLRRFLHPERAEALEARGRRMLETGVMVREL